MFRKCDFIDWDSIRDCRKSTWNERKRTYSTIDGWRRLYKRIQGSIHSLLCSEIPMVTPKTLIKWVVPYPNVAIMKWPSILCLIVSAYCLLTVYIFLIIAMFSPWYYERNPDNYREQTVYYWADIIEYDSDGVPTVTDYSTERLDNFHFLITMSLIWLSIGCVCFWYFCWWWCCSCVNRCFNLWSLPGIFYSAIFSLGLLSTSFLCLSWIAFCFAPFAWKDDKDSTGNDCTGTCDSFSGSDSNLIWGPYVGWSFCLVASIGACLAVVLYKVAYMWDGYNRSWVHKYHSSGEEQFWSDEDLILEEGDEFALDAEDPDGGLARVRFQE